MAAGLGFKTFAVGEVLSAANVNGYLMQGVLVFANATARDAAITSPQEGQFAYLKDTNVTTYYTGSAWANLDTTGMTNPMTTTGDTIYSSSGSTPARLGIGSTGQVLTVAGGVPTWATPAAGGGGKVLQVVSATTSTDVLINTTTQTDTGITATITPTSSSSKVLIIISANACVAGTNPAEIGARVMRDSTNIHNYGDYAFHRAGSASGGNAENAVNHSVTYLDSPATTSATTYKLQAKVRTGGEVRFQFLSTAPSTITLLEIGV